LDLRFHYASVIFHIMDKLLTYRGRVATPEEISFIRGLIAEHPTESRARISKRLCRIWNWVQLNGALRAIVCNGYLLRLAEAGLIELPARQKKSPGPHVRRKIPPRVEIDRSPISCSLSQLGPLRIRQVRRSPEERLCEGLIAQYHYLGACWPVGAHLKHLVLAGERPIAAMAWSSPPRHLGARDRHIGWTQEERRRNLHLIVYQTRFLILPWVRVPNLATHLLGCMAKVLPEDWQRLYCHPIYFLETFTDPSRYHGTCYRAANWTCLGQTTGRGKNDQTGLVNRPIKTVWGYALVEDFRERLRDA
jgi:hypothetical protein